MRCQADSGVLAFDTVLNRHQLQKLREEMSRGRTMVLPNSPPAKLAISLVDREGSVVGPSGAVVAAAIMAGFSDDVELIKNRNTPALTRDPDTLVVLPNERTTEGLKILSEHIRVEFDNPPKVIINKVNGPPSPDHVHMAMRMQMSLSQRDQHAILNGAT